MKTSRICTLALVLALALCLTPAVAFAVTDGDFSAADTSDTTLGTCDPEQEKYQAEFNSKGELVHEGFTVLEPKKGGVYGVNEGIVGQIKTTNFLVHLVNGFIDSKIDYVIYEIWQGDTLLLQDRCEYSEESDWFSYQVGSTISTQTFTPTKAGKYTVKIGFANTRIGGFDKEVTDENHVATYSFKVVKKKANTLTAKAKTVTLSASKLKKAKQSVKASKAFSVKKAKGAVTYKASADVTKNAMKKISVSKKGNVTVKKGTAKGTYKIKVQVTAAGTPYYKPKTRTVTLAVKVK